MCYVQGLANFILVIQKHPKLVTFKSQAYRIKCVYKTGVQNIETGFNVSMLTTAGTIANTGTVYPSYILDKFNMYILRFEL